MDLLYQKAISNFKLIFSVLLFMHFVFKFFLEG